MNLWSAARYDLGLSESEFWKMTGRTLFALIRRHKAAQDRQQFLTGLLASEIVNYSMCRPKDMWRTPSDYMPKKKEKERTELEIAIDFAEKMQFIAWQGGEPPTRPN